MRPGKMARMRDDAGFLGRRTRNLQRAAERGQALIEMALVTPLLIALLLGIIEVGRYAELSIVVADSARTGAIYGAQNLVTAVDTVGIQNAAQNDANLGANLIVSSTSGLLPSTQLSSLACTVTSDSGSPSPYVIVRTNFTTNSLFTSRQFTFQGCAQMQVAQ
jgi:Flp pilus assembly protein TadG